MKQHNTLHGTLSQRMTTEIHRELLGAREKHEEARKLKAKMESEAEEVFKVVRKANSFLVFTIVLAVGTVLLSLYVTFISNA